MHGKIKVWICLFWNHFLEMVLTNWVRVYSHIWPIGMCRSNGSLFYKKTLNMGPVFHQKILKHGSTFLTEPKFSGFSHGENPGNREFFEKWAYISRKILKNGYPFLPKSPLKMGKGFEARAAHPCPTQIWVPPG